MQLEGRQEQRTSVKRLICRRTGGEGCVCWPFGSVDIYSARLLKRSGRRFTLDFGCTVCFARRECESVWVVGMRMQGPLCHSAGNCLDGFRPKVDLVSVSHLHFVVLPISFSYLRLFGCAQVC